MTQIAVLRKSGKGFEVIHAGGVEKFDDFDKASAKQTEINEAIQGSINGDKTEGVKMTIKNGKATLSASGLGYKGILLGGYAADLEALIAYFGSPADSRAAKDFAANRAKLCASWQAYGDLPVGATLPDGTTKPAPKGR